ncbi:hypothetical protein BH09VER1_BH09VER1_05600 [soil metagenome]
MIDLLFILILTLAGPSLDALYAKWAFQRAGRGASIVRLFAEISILSLATLAMGRAFFDLLDYYGLAQGEGKLMAKAIVLYGSGILLCIFNLAVWMEFASIFWKRRKTARPVARTG